MYNFFQKKKSEWKPYMGNIVCKSLNKEKLLLKVVVQGTLSILYHVSEQLSIPLNKLPQGRHEHGVVDGLALYGNGVESLILASVAYT